MEWYGLAFRCDALRDLKLKFIACGCRMNEWMNAYMKFFGQYREIWLIVNVNVCEIETICPGGVRVRVRVRWA